MTALTLYLAENRRAGYWITLGVFSSLALAQADCHRDATEDALPALVWSLHDTGRCWSSQTVPLGTYDEATWRVSAWELDGGRQGWPTAERVA